MARVDPEDFVADGFTATVPTSTCWSFNAEGPGGFYGGQGGDGDFAVTAFPGDDDPAGHCTLFWRSGRARTIKMKVLDGIADDSFEVHALRPDGTMVTVFSYTATPFALLNTFGEIPDLAVEEDWVVHEFTYQPGFPKPGAGQGLHLMIVLTADPVEWAAWWTTCTETWCNPLDDFDTFGALAVDWIEVWS